MRKTETDMWEHGILMEDISPAYWLLSWIEKVQSSKAGFL